jgi:hypothetical protein
MRDQAPCPRLWATQDSKTGMERMKETISRSGIDRRTLLSTLVLLPAVSGPPLSVAAAAWTASSEALPSWNEGSGKRVILDAPAAHDIQLPET